MSKGSNRSFVADLTDEAIAIYHHTVRGGKLTFGDISGIMQMPEVVCRERVDELLALGLVEKSGDGDAISPVNPRVAAAEATVRIEAEIRRRREEIASINDLAAKLLLRYGNGEDALSGIQRINDFAAVQLAFESVSSQCEREVLCALSDAPCHSAKLRQSLPRDLDMLSKGVSMRILCQTAMCHDRHTVDYVKAVSEKGAQVRTLDEFFNSLIIFDRKTAIIPGEHNDSSATIIRERSVVGFLYSLFDRSWTVASPFGARNRDYTDICNNWGDSITHRIILLLVDGKKDEAIARRLGISVRTCRKHVASIMSKLGAESRFQAGYLSRTLVDSGAVSGQTKSTHGSEVTLVASARSTALRRYAPAVAVRMALTAVAGPSRHNDDPATSQVAPAS